jgi:hypothetical protein
MDLQPYLEDNRRGRRCSALVLFAILLLPAITPVARAAQPVPVIPCAVQAWSVPVHTGGWGLNKVFNRVETFLSNRTRMIQLGAIGLCLGLFILLRR